MSNVKMDRAKFQAILKERLWDGACKIIFRAVFGEIWQSWRLQQKSNYKNQSFLICIANTEKLPLCKAVITSNVVSAKW